MKRTFGGFNISLPYDFKVHGLVKREVRKGDVHWAAIITDDMGDMRWVWDGREIATLCRITITGRTAQSYNYTYCVKGKVEWANDDGVFGADEDHVGECWLMINTYHGHELGAATVDENGKFVLEIARLNP